MNKTKKVKQIIKDAKSTIVSVAFEKANGEKRIMSFNARHKEGIKGADASESAQKAVQTRKKNNPNLVNVIDLGVKKKTKDAVKSWRSFDCERVISVKSGGKVYQF